jgi:hypothetical protein
VNDTEYLEHCRGLLRDFADSLDQQTAHLPADDPLRELVAGFRSLAASTGSLHGEGTALVSRLFTTYPELAPLLPRQLLWFFGGDCLHYLPDEEISMFQQLEDMRLEAAARGETFDLRDGRAKLLNLQ